MSQLGRALVVEDDGAWQQLLGEILIDSGLAVDMATGLDSALASLHATAYRLAVVDLSLGGSDHRNQDGLQVIDAIRRLNPGCVAVLLTGFATVELAVSAITEYGSYTCLRKEVFRRAEFRQIIRQALSVPPVAAPSSPAGRDAASTRQQGAPTVRHKKPAVLIVEDDAGWRSILAELVEETGRRPRLCSSYGEALGNLRKHKFALLTVDLSLASSVDEDNMDGYRILAQARAGGIPALVVSGMAHASDIERAFGEYGIAAYLEKQSFDRAAFRRAVEDAVASAAPAGGDLAALTGRERDVLNLLAQGLTNKDIAASLVISTNTVKRHLKAVFAKLGVNTRAAAAAKALTLRLDASPD